MRVIEFAEMLRNSIEEKIKECKWSIHEAHNPIYNQSLAVEIEALDVAEFGKLNTVVDEALKQGRKEGFTDRDVGDMTRRKLLTAVYSRMTVSRALPPSAKHMEKAR
jgi:hypothetical protein